MTVDRRPAGADPAGPVPRDEVDRTLALLWRERGAEPSEPIRGRRPTLALERIIAAAVEVADAEGLAATSMHRVARELGAGTMTLYTYVAGKTELIDLMVDEVLLERRLPAPGEPRAGEWRAQVTLYAERTRDAYRRHPWLRETSRVRPVLGPGQFAGQEYLLSIMDGLGLPVREVVAAANCVAGYVDANAAVEAESRHLERSTGQSDDAWWSRRSSFWDSYFDVTVHPAMNRVWLAGGFDRGTREQASDACEFGLERLLDGIEERVGRPLT
ncbi:TetR/AcrR family transcriptional regulator [Amycolatopsis jiangsuensis]|uniref:AcrR family transcriptional regulator n=1 Tax=Amycolatopsis jiangsuensis TaxID=1181879 RepID=A0A840J5B3_9PSEU|nr:TetR/AcrR family transcriptional regulator [Amycolatopsis jiangsuensis]MBB4688909.1 AcrR family transcriptional regulator [Amycolatopsis jiangsuensis]